MIVLVLLTAAAATVLWPAHRQIRRETPELPTPEAVARADRDALDLPVRLRWLNTASQPSPRSGVLDPGSDPGRETPYVMSHPSFVVEWDDGRILLVDVGMTREGALAFGQPLEWLAGAEPMVPGRSVAEALTEWLGGNLERVEAALFSHLHADHVGGTPELCEQLPGRLRVFMTRGQAERPNYTTAPGLEIVETSGCVEIRVLPDSSFRPVPGFPGVFVIASAGHTPGSQIVTVRLRDGALYAITGDSVNHRDAIRHDIPKPTLYRWLVVPESEARQQQVRHFLADLHRAGFTLLVNHDQLHLEATGLEVLPTTRSPGEASR